MFYTNCSLNTASCNRRAAAGIMAVVAAVIAMSSEEKNCVKNHRVLVESLYSYVA